MQQTTGRDGDMKKLAFMAVACAAVCAVAGAACMFGGCGGEASDDDAEAFVTGIQNTIAYEGSYTYIYESEISYQYKDDSTEKDSTTTTRSITYDEKTGKAANVYESDGYVSSGLYFIPGDDAVTEYVTYNNGDNYTELTIEATSSLYSSYSSLSKQLSLSDPSSVSTVDDMKAYMSKTAAGSTWAASSCTLTVSGGTYTLTYNEDTGDSSASASAGMTVKFVFSSNRLTKITSVVSASLSSGSTSFTTTTTMTADISYSYKSSLMPSSFD